MMEVMPMSATRVSLPRIITSLSIGKSSLWFFNQMLQQSINHLSQQVPYCVHQSIFFNNPSIIFLNCQYIPEMMQITRVSLPRIITSLSTEKSSLLSSSINLLQQSINLLQQSINLLQKSINLLQQSINLLQQSTNLLQQSINLLQQSINHITQQSMYTGHDTSHQGLAPCIITRLNTGIFLMAQKNQLASTIHQSFLSIVITSENDASHQGLITLQCWQPPQQMKSFHN